MESRATIVSDSDAALEEACDLAGLRVPPRHERFEARFPGQDQGDDPALARGARRKQALERGPQALEAFGRPARQRLPGVRQYLEVSRASPAPSRLRIRAAADRDRDRQDRTTQDVHVCPPIIVAREWMEPTVGRDEVTTSERGTS